MTGAVPIIPRLKFSDDRGVPVAGGTVTVYLAGTTTLASVFQDANLTIASTNPVTLDAVGTAAFWLANNHRYKLWARYPSPDGGLTPGATVPGWPVDDVPGAADATSTDSALRADLLEATGSALVSFQQSGTAAAVQTVNLKLTRQVDIDDFAGDDFTTRFSRAIAAVQGDRVKLEMGRGFFALEEPLVVTGCLTLVGVSDSNNGSVINCTHSSGNGITLDTTDQINIERLQIRGLPAANGGALLQVGSDTSMNQFSKLRDVRFQGGYFQCMFESASTWMLDNCRFFSPVSRGVSIENRLQTDSGDPTIQGCVFSGTAGLGDAVHQASAGGLKMIGCKVIQFANGYVLSLASGVATSDLFISGCSFEAFTGSGILLDRGAGVVFGAVQIIGNEISGALVPINMNNDTGPWLSHMEIVGNNLGYSAGGTGLVLAGCADVTVGPNTIVGLGTGTGINIGAGVSDTDISRNRLSGHTAGFAIVNNSTASTIRIHDNPGYNTGVVSAVTPGSSPWTLTNGPSPTDYSLAATTSITNITVGGVSFLAAATGANAPYPLRLGPNEVAVITYTGTLTVKKMVH